jgi:hypothetical protein
MRARALDASPGPTALPQESLVRDRERVSILRGAAGKTTRRSPRPPIANSVTAAAAWLVVGIWLRLRLRYVGCGSPGVDASASSGLFDGWWPIGVYALASAIALIWFTTSMEATCKEAVVRKLVWGAAAGLGLIVFLWALLGWAINFTGCGGE